MPRVPFLAALVALPALALAQTPPPAVDVLKAHIEAVMAAPDGGADRQIKVVDVGKLNVGVGVLVQGARKTAEGDPIMGISHAQVTEVYYVLSGSGVLITGTEVRDEEPLPADSEVVQVAVGPSHRATFIGGTRRTVSAGDVVVIPAGVLHGWVEIPEEVRYLSIRPDPDRVLPAGYVNPAIAQTAQNAAQSSTAATAAAAGAIAASANGPIERTPDGKPNLNGIWQALVPANYDIRPHEAQPAPLPMLGAIGATPPSLGVIEGGQIPYLPEALEQQRKNYQDRFELDPERKCFMPGIPRATYMPYPFQIFQSGEHIAFAYQFANAVRMIHMKDPGPAPDSFWMGWSKGHWEGDTLVIEVTDQKADTWLDRAGNFHSDQLRVVERYTPMGPNHLLYEATLEDPKVYSRPWKISLPLYRRVEANAELLEFKCVPFAEEIMYGHLRKGYQGDREPTE